MKYTKKIIKHFLIIACLVLILILPYLVFAGNPALDKLEEVGSGQGPYAEATEYSASELIGTAVNILLSLLGVIFMVLIIYAGYNWMTAQGDDEKVNKAKDTITRSITGLIIVIGAYAIWYFIWTFVVA